MYCRNCGKEINENQVICLECGVKKGDGKNFCPNCGKPVEENATVCMNCGVAIKKPNNFGSYDKITIALVCFFLGSIGIHNFILGENKKGIVKIVASLCCGLGEILALIDFIRILVDKYDVDPEKLI